MKTRTAFLGLALATIIGFSIVGTSEALPPPAGLTTPRFTPVPLTYVYPAKDRKGKLIIRNRGKRQAFWLETRWFNPELPNNKKYIISKKYIVVPVPKGGKHFCSNNCGR